MGEVKGNQSLEINNETKEQNMCYALFFSLKTGYAQMLFILQR